MMQFTRSFFGGIGCAVVLMVSPCAASEPAIFAIEEVWELAVNEPDGENVSPQVTFFTSPSVNDDQTYFQVQMNYAADGGFSKGGFHVAAIHHGQMVDEERSGTRQVLTKHHDRIRWTNVMVAIDNTVYFAIKDGSGHDWGTFGGPDYLVQMLGNGTNGLSKYDFQQSLDSVDIGFGANRVDSITLIEVRVTDKDGRKVIVPVNRQP